MDINFVVWQMNYISEANLLNMNSELSLPNFTGTMAKVLLAFSTVGFCYHYVGIDIPSHWD